MSQFLRFPAESALGSLLNLRIHPAPYWERIPQAHLSEDARLILDACLALQRSQDQDNTNIDDEIISASAKTLVGSLSDTKLQKLSLITWHFDASGSQVMMQFGKQSMTNGRGSRNKMGQCLTLKPPTTFCCALPWARSRTGFDLGSLI